jgi:hypothetical protein
MIGQESLPASVRRAIEVNAIGQLLANLHDPVIDLGLRRLNDLLILLANLLLDEGAADQLVESDRGRENAKPATGRVEHGKSNFVVQVAGQDGLIVDDGDNVIEHDGFGWNGWLRRLGAGSGRGQGSQAKRREKQTNWSPVAHQKLCPRLKKKLK